MTTPSCVKAAISLTLALLLMTTAGCSLTFAKKPVTITIWHYYNGPQQKAFDTLVSRYNDTEGVKNNITVVASSQGDIRQLSQRVLASASGESTEPMPNIFSAYPDNALEVDKLGKVAPLDKYISDSELDKYISGYIKEGRFDESGSLKIFPVAKSTELLYLNKTYWDPFAAATGVKLEDLATVDGLATVARKYYNWTDSQTELSNDGQAFFGRDSMSNYLLVGSRQLGTIILDSEQGKGSINLPPDILHRLWDNFYIPYISGYYVHYGKFRSDDFKSGKIAAFVGSSSGVAYLPEKVQLDDNSSHDIEIMVLEAPKMQGGQSIAVQQGAGMVVTKSDTTTERACVEFLKWFTAPAQNIPFAISAGYLPVMKESSSFDAISSYSGLIDSDNMLELSSVQVALSTIESCELYVNKVFVGSNNARKIFDSVLIDKARADRQIVQLMLATGVSLDAAVAQFTQPANFDVWFDELSAKLTDTIG